MPKDVERLVKKLEKKPEIESPWGLAIWMKRRGYKMPPKKAEEERTDVTENEIRVRIEEPDKYDPDSFRYKEITDGVRSVIGCPKGKFAEGRCTVGTEVQALRFDRDKFTKSEAEKWAKSKGFKGKVEEPKGRTIGEMGISEPIREREHKHWKKEEKLVSEEKDMLKELFCFMKWLSDKGKKFPEKEEELEQLIKQYDVESFAQKEKEPEFHGTPEQEKIDKFVKAEEDTTTDAISEQKKKERTSAVPYKITPQYKPRWEKKAEDSAPPLPSRQPKKDPFVKEYREKQKPIETKKAKVPKIPESVKQRDYTKPLREKEEKKAGIGDKIKKFIDPAPPKPSTTTTPPLTKKTVRNTVRKIRSGV